MPRGDEVNDELRFSDRDDDVDDLGYGGGGGSSSYDDDDEEDGGWTTHKDDSDDLWDSTDDADDDCPRSAVITLLDLDMTTDRVLTRELCTSGRLADDGHEGVGISGKDLLAVRRNSIEQGGA